jgi:hypothetical protein
MHTFPNLKSNKSGLNCWWLHAHLIIMVTFLDNGPESSLQWNCCRLRFVHGSAWPRKEMLQELTDFLVPVLSSNIYLCLESIYALNLSSSIIQDWGFYRSGGGRRWRRIWMQPCLHSLSWLDRSDHGNMWNGGVSANASGRLVSFSLYIGTATGHLFWNTAVCSSVYIEMHTSPNLKSTKSGLNCW